MKFSEAEVAHENPRVSHAYDMVCSTHGGLTAHGLLRSLMTSVDINVLTLYSASLRITSSYMLI